MSRLPFLFLCSFMMAIDTSFGTAAIYCHKHQVADLVIFMDNSCFYLYKALTNITTAFNTCHGARTRLVFLDTGDRQTTLVTEIGVIDIWVGATKIDGVWSFRDDNSIWLPVDYPPWDPAAIPGAGITVALTSGNTTWHGADPLEQHSFVCEDPLPLELNMDRCLDSPTLPDVAYALYQPANMHCYVGLSTPANYTLATSMCRDLGFHVVHLETAGEKAMLRTELNARGLPTNVWLGLEMDSSVADTWVWKDGHTSTVLDVVSGTWKSYYPSTPQFAFLESEGKFQQAESSEMKMVACEKDLLEEGFTALVCKHDKERGMTDATVYVNSACYYYVAEPTLYAAAKNTCESMGTHLIHPKKQLEYDLLTDKLKYFWFWLGIERSTTDVWQWVSKFMDPVTVLSQEQQWDNASYCLESFCPTFSLAYVKAGVWYQTNILDMHAFVCEAFVPEAPIRLFSPDTLTYLLCSRNLASLRILKPDIATCFYILYNPMGRPDADSTCYAQETHMLHLDDANLQKWLEGQLTDKGLPTNVWLGMNRYQDDYWMWYTNNWSGRVNSTRFITYDPIGPDAVVMAPPGKWNQSDPGDINYVICEEKLDLTVFERVIRPTTTTTTPIPRNVACSTVEVLCESTRVTTFKVNTTSETFVQIRNETGQSRLECSKDCSLVNACNMFRVSSPGSSSSTCVLYTLQPQGDFSPDCSEAFSCYRKQCVYP